MVLHSRLSGSKAKLSVVKSLTSDAIQPLLVFKPAKLSEGLQKRRSHLICICIFNTLRVAISMALAKADWVAKIFVSDGLSFWCNELTNIDLLAGKQFCEQVFRVIYQCALDCSVDDPFRLELFTVAHHFYMRSASFKHESLDKIIYNAGWAASKGTVSRRNSVLEYYCTSISLDLTYRPSMLPWVEHGLILSDKVWHFNPEFWLVNALP